MLHGGPDALRFLPIDGLALDPFKYATHILLLKSSKLKIPFFPSFTNL